MSILGADGKPIENNCEKCKNYGYYQVGAKKDEAMQMFCECSIGLELRKIGIQWRLSDLKNLMEDIIPRLAVIKEKTSENPEKAKEFINNLSKDLEGIKEKAEKSLKEL